MKSQLTVILAGILILGFSGLAHADFVGNKDSKIFHTDQCPIGKQMKTENKVVFKTAAEAVQAGYTPCKKCNPADVVQAGFVGNKDSKIYHKADCRLVAKMKAGNTVNFASAEEAEKAGYKPCSICLASDKKPDVVVAKADDKTSLDKKAAKKSGKK